MTRKRRWATFDARLAACARLSKTPGAGAAIRGRAGPSSTTFVIHRAYSPCSCLFRRGHPRPHRTAYSPCLFTVFVNKLIQARPHTKAGVSNAARPPQTLRHVAADAAIRGRSRARYAAVQDSESVHVRLRKGFMSFAGKARGKMAWLSLNKLSKQRA